jgi:hypothetical protein
MTPMVPLRPAEETGRLGRAVYDQQIRPRLRPEDEGKFVVLDIHTGEYEVDSSDYVAAMKMRARRPAGELWVERVGRPTAYTLLGLGR